MDNTTEENVIFLKDLIFAALRRWKVALVAALILAVLLGGFKAVSDLGKVNLNQDTAAYAAQTEQYLLERKALEDTVAGQQINIENQLDYLDNSVFMALDPFDHYQAKLNIYVDANYQVMPGNVLQDPDKTAYILNAYHAQLTSSQTLTLLADSVGIDVRYLSELCKAELPNDSSCVTITIIYPTEEGASILLEQLLKQFDVVRELLCQTIQAHDTQILEQSVSHSSNPDLVDLQRTAETYLLELQDVLASTEMALAQLVPPVAPGLSVSAFVKEVVIFAVLGAVAGAGLVAMYAWVEMIASQKVYSSRALRARTGVKLLGCICPRIPANIIDRFLLKLEGRELSDPEDRAAVLAKDVRNRCDGVNRLLVTGDGDTDQREFIVSALSQAMPGVQVCDHGSILRSAEAGDALKASDKVLLIEQCGSSRYNNIVSQCQKAVDYQKEILGCILLGG